jgi:hypothetical protein
MRSAFMAMVLVVAACGPRPMPQAAEQEEESVAPPRGDVSCGSATCGPDEYCEERCTCCGAYIPDPSQASGTSTCLPLPDSCKTGNGPECQQRTVSIPCA